METKQLIYEMLTENTGKHFLDSGGDDNRGWQKNQKKTLQDFEDEEEETIHKDGDYYYRNVSVFHYLSQLELDDIFRDLNKLNTNTKEIQNITIKVVLLKNHLKIKKQVYLKNM